MGEKERKFPTFPMLISLSRAVSVGAAAQTATGFNPNTLVCDLSQAESRHACGRGTFNWGLRRQNVPSRAERKTMSWTTLLESSCSRRRLQRAHMQEFASFNALSTVAWGGRRRRCCKERHARSFSAIESGEPHSVEAGALEPRVFWRRSCRINLVELV